EVARAERRIHGRATELLAVRPERENLVLVGQREVDVTRAAQREAGRVLAVLQRRQRAPGPGSTVGADGLDEHHPSVRGHRRRNREHDVASPVERQPCRAGGTVGPGERAVHQPLSGCATTPTYAPNGTLPRVRNEQVPSAIEGQGPGPRRP